MSRFGLATPGTGAMGPEPIPLPDLRPARRRRWPWLSLVVVVLAGVGTGTWALGRATAPRPPTPPAPPRLVPVLATTSALPAGTRLTSADLSVVRVATPSGSWIPSAYEGVVVGRSTSAPLPAGALVTSADLSRQPFPGPGQQMVGLELKGGEAPTGALTAGEHVEVVFVPASSEPPYPKPVPLTSAAVWAVAAGGDQGTVDVDLVVPSDDAVAIAAYALHDEIALVGER
jgi:hypothetical protein